MEEFQNYMGHLWIQVNGDEITVGINEEGVDEFSEISSIQLPAEGEEVYADDSCGEIETDQGAMGLYSPVKGIVSEVNVAVSERPGLIIDDCQGDGWIFRVEADNIDDLDVTSGDDE